MRRGKSNIIGIDGVTNKQYFDMYGDPKMEDESDADEPYTTRRSWTTQSKGLPFKRRSLRVPGPNYSIFTKKGKKIVKR
jgi:hypothetical protein